MEQIRRIIRPTDVPDQGMFFQLHLYPYLTFISGLLCDLLWSDPDEFDCGWAANARGAGYVRASLFDL